MWECFIMEANWKLKDNGILMGKNGQEKTRHFGLREQFEQRYRDKTGKGIFRELFKVLGS